MITFVFGMDHAHHLHWLTRTVVPISQCQFSQNPMLCGSNSILMVPMKTKDLSWGWSLCLKVTFQHCTHRLYVFNGYKSHVGWLVKVGLLSPIFSMLMTTCSPYFMTHYVYLCAQWWCHIDCQYIEYCTVSCLTQWCKHQNKKLIKSMCTQSWLKIGKYNSSEMIKINYAYFLIQVLHHVHCYL